MMSARRWRLSNDGSYADLSAYGMDIVNNVSCGLHSSAALTSFLNNGTCGRITYRY